MRRNITARLLAWKNNSKRMPLLLLGARQVGKTYSLLAFAKAQYDNYLYINFEQSPTLADIFEADLDSLRILADLELYFSKKINPLTDIIIFDEVQRVPKCITSLKYFAEQLPSYPIVCAGSLLGVMLNRESFSFPVGKVEFDYLFPLSFDEFLLALDLDMLVEKIVECYQTDQPMPIATHEKLLKLYKDYLCVGGMPVAVLDYIDKQADLIQFDRNIHTNIVNAYIADMSKYCHASDTVKIQAIYKSIPEQLAKENKKFKYSIVKKGAKSSHFDAAIEWLIMSRVQLICRATQTAKLPLKAYLTHNMFKMYLSDNGLLNSLAGLPFSLIKNDDNHIYRGAIVENYVAVALTAQRHELYYYKDNHFEVDFLIQKNDLIIPIEVKAKSNSRSRSFNAYIKKYQPELAIRLSQKNFGKKDVIKSVPLYAAFCI